MACSSREQQDKAVSWWGDLVRTVGPSLANSKLVNYQVSCSSQQVAYEKILAWILDADPRQPLILFGGVGRGKDHLAVAAARGRAKVRHAACHWCFVPHLFARMRDAIGSNDPESRTLAREREADLLILSDPLPAIGELTPWQAAMLLDLMDHRNRHHKTTIVTANCTTHEEANRRLTPPLWDRMRDAALIVLCDWPGYRKPSEVVKA